MPQQRHNIFVVSLERWLMQLDGQQAPVPIEKIGSVVRWHDSPEEAYRAFETIDLRAAWEALGFDDVGLRALLIDFQSNEILGEKRFTLEDHALMLVLDTFMSDFDDQHHDRS